MERRSLLQHANLFEILKTIDPEGHHNMSYEKNKRTAHLVLTGDQNPQASAT